MKEYCFPSIDLLAESPDTSIYQNPEYVMEQRKKLQEMFDSFGMDVKTVDCYFNSVALLFTLRLGEGITPKHVRNLKKDIELTMADPVDFQDDEENSQVMYISVRDKSRPIIALKQIIHSSEFIQCPSRLPVAAGIDHFGGKLIIDLEQVNNLLVVGVTGSGKSVFLGDLITSILYRSRPDEVQFVFFDFKGVELPLFDNIPHLIVPSVKRKSQAMKELGKLEEIANRRSFMLATAHKDSFAEYNQSVSDPLPRIVLVIDEYMSLIEKRGKTNTEFTRIIQHLATATRQTGIHVVLSTQRPSMEVITREISDAIPHRVSFYVTTGTDSKIAINRTGAQRLLGSGDMIYVDTSSEKGTHAQAAYITDKEIDSVIKACNSQWEYRADDE